MPKFISVTCAGPHSGNGGETLIAADHIVSLSQVTCPALGLVVPAQIYTEVRLSTGDVITVSNRIGDIAKEAETDGPLW